MKANDKLLVTVLSPNDHSEEKNEWLDVSANQLNRAYSDEESQYSQAMIKEPNPEYKK